MRIFTVLLLGTALLSACREPSKHYVAGAGKNSSSINSEANTGTTPQTPSSPASPASPAHQETTTPGGDTAQPSNNPAPGMGGTTTNPQTPETNPAPADPATPPATPNPASGEVKGHLDLNFTMIGPAKAGAFRSRGHVRAVWVTDSNNAFIRTLDYHADKRGQYLKRYDSFAGSKIDGSSGATDKSLSTPLSAKISWDLKGKDGKLVKPGNYKVWFEMAETNVSGTVTQPADGKQSFDGTAGYAFHLVPVTVDDKAGASSDAKSPVFTTINFQRRLD